MRFVFLLSNIILTISLSAQDFFEKSNLFFAENVSNNKVDYSKLAVNSASLNELVTIITKQDLSQLKEPNRKAFLINSYNLLVIHQILEKWPTTETV